MSFRGGLVGLDQLDSDLVTSIHQGFVHNAKATLSQAALLALRIATDRDVVPAGKEVSDLIVNYTSLALASAD